RDRLRHGAARCAEILGECARDVAVAIARRQVGQRLEMDRQQAVPRRIVPQGLVDQGGEPFEQEEGRRHPTNVSCPNTLDKQRWTAMFGLETSLPAIAGDRKAPKKGENENEARRDRTRPRLRYPGRRRRYRGSVS